MFQIDILGDVLEAMTDGVVLVDAGGRVLYVNCEIERLSGYQRSELVGHGVELLVPPRLGPAHEQHRDGHLRAAGRRVMAGGLDVRLRRRDGAHVLVDVTLSPLATRVGTHVVAVVREPAGRPASEEARRLVLADERQRIAGELYDRVIQRLFAVGLSLQHTAQLSSQAQVARRLESDLVALDQVISDLRGCIFELGPAAARWFPA